MAVYLRLTYITEYSCAGIRLWNSLKEKGHLEKINPTLPTMQIFNEFTIIISSKPSPVNQIYLHNQKEVPIPLGKIRG